MTDDERPPSPGDVADLTAAVERLAPQIAALNKASGGQLLALTASVTSTRRWALALTGACVVLVAALALLVVALVRIDANSDRIAATSARLEHSSTVGRQQALCPLFRVFLGARSPQARAAYPDGPEAYDRAFGVLDRGYTALRCGTFHGGAPSLGLERHR